MSANGRTWDVTLSKTGTKEYPALCVNLPAGISRALVEKEMHRARLTVTESGILITPYKGARRAVSQTEVIQLPDWSTA